MKEKTQIDQSVFESFLRGDQVAFTRIYHSLKGEIYIFAVKITKSREDGEDITVKVFMKLWEYRDRIDSLVHLRRWLFFTARNLCINVLRERRYPQEFTDELHSETEARGSHPDRPPRTREMVWASLMEELWNIVNALPIMRRKVMLMRFQENKSMEEIASSLNLSVQTVYNHMARAKAQIRKLLDKGHFEGEEAFVILLLVGFCDIAS
ncbi:RNA polymerase sigma factor [Puia sp. P3]|uniref:RNA polymerase sigma factor n=1 Tax=Puia sp. P3 TaxID=3423952 RepID=UPI003D67A7EA